MTILDLILAVVGLPLLAYTLYLFALTVLAFGANARSRPAGHMTRFRIVVPAHNEERGLARTLWSLRRLDYPQSRYRVIVVADNCTDRTAEVARLCGARALERWNPELRGKGYALQFAFDALAAEPEGAWDAVVVVDADTEVTPNLLSALDGRIAAGADAVQAAYLPTPTAGGSLSVITEVAFTAIHVIRSSARERLGLSSGLKGNGMAFSRKALASVPHDAFSRTEDLEFGLRLGLAGIRVAYAGDATVFGDMPRDNGAAATQRRRWIGGRVEMARSHVPSLLREAFRRRSPMLADMAVDLLIPPVSVLAMALVAGLPLAGLVALLSGGLTVGAAVWLTAAVALGVHVLDAARRAGRLGALLEAPSHLIAYAADKLLITFRSFDDSDRSWIRTARPGETA